MRQSSARQLAPFLTAVLAVLAGCDAAEPNPGGDTPADTTLGALAAARGIDFGTAAETRFTSLEADYMRTLADQFGAVTPGNAMKFDAVHPSRATYTFSDADALVTFAEAAGMKIRGHTLVWHSQLPFWLTSGSWTRQQLVDILREHITTVVTRYKGRVYAWDVVNEAVSDDGSMRHTIWYDRIGPDYISLAFQWAHEADPDALLFYNDYNAEGSGTKSDAVYALVRDLVEAGVPVDGVGLQAHLSLSWFPSATDLALNMRRIADLGLDVHITEMDVRVPMPASPSELAEQAAIYRSVVETCLIADRCTGFTTWGFTDRYSWIPSTFQGFGAALIFDENFDPKPAYWAIRDALE